ncbi:MAG: hypothetical protein AVDCRST_MAG85-3473, partial [uncultured Solirubrobacteraceae bacterium]
DDARCRTRRRAVELPRGGGPWGSCDAGLRRRVRARPSSELAAVRARRRCPVGRPRS